MAPSPAYYVWISNGKPYKLIRPAAALQGALRGHGLTVYDYPNEAHLRASTPEDHTPFSATGWPVKSAYGVGHAIDVMPRSDSAAGRAENADIARKLIADRNASVPGVLWIKYINWTDEAGICRQERWTPNHTSRTSTDKGHIHISGRSDCDNDTRADTYDPMRGFAAGDEDDMGNTWLEPLTQGSEGFAGQQRDTALAFTWQASNKAAANTDKLLAAAAADEARDAAILAAVKALAVATGSDPTPILDAIEVVRSETHDLVTQLQQQLAVVQARNLKQAQALAAAGVAFEAADD